MRTLSLARAGACIVLTVGLSIGCVPGVLAIAQEGGVSASVAKRAAEQSAQQGSTAAFEKSEVVYATLDAAGAPEEAYVVNRFEVSEAGSVVDWGAYDEVSNLTNQEPLARTDEATVFEAQEGTFFYQGSVSQVDLPWKVSLTYTLDGREVSAADLAGANGALEVHVTTARNDAADLDASFYECYMLQITFTLDGNKTRDVEAEGATCALSGQDRTVAFTVLPGHDADFTLSAQVADFEMTGVQIAALPYTSVVEMPDASGMTDGMSQLADAVSQLSEGTDALAAGASAFGSGAGELSGGMSAFGAGLGQLDAHSGELVSGSAAIGDALRQVSAALDGVDLSAIDDIEQLVSALRSLADQIGDLGGASEDVCAALDEVMGRLPDTALPEDELARLRELVEQAGNEADAETLAKLEAAYEAALEAGRAWEGGLRDSLDQVISSNENLRQIIAAIRSLIGKIDADDLESFDIGQVKELAEGLQSLSAAYDSFHDGLVSYTGGVSELSDSYAQIEAGTSALAGGAESLASGAESLASGMRALDGVTIALPDVMRAEVERMMADYEFPSFEPISFASPDNEGVVEVQFVLSTAAIEKPEQEAAEVAKEQPSMLDRLWALFGGSAD